MIPLDFDKWRAEHNAIAEVSRHRGKTSYELMMTIFGKEPRSNSDTRSVSYMLDKGHPTNSLKPNSCVPLFEKIKIKTLTLHG